MTNLLIITSDVVIYSIVPRLLPTRGIGDIQRLQAWCPPKCKVPNGEGEGKIWRGSVSLCWAYITLQYHLWGDGLKLTFTALGKVSSRGLVVLSLCVQLTSVKHSFVSKWAWVWRKEVPRLACKWVKKRAPRCI